MARVTLGSPSVTPRDGVVESLTACGSSPDCEAFLPHSEAIHPGKKALICEREGFRPIRAFQTIGENACLARGLASKSGGRAS
jgi:hypothetical protein